MKPITNQPLTRVKEKYQITLPASVRTAAGIEIGDLLEAVAHGSTIVLTQKAVVDRDTADAIAEGLADMRAGRVTKPARTMKEVKKQLRK